MLIILDILGYIKFISFALIFCSLSGSCARRLSDAFEKECTPETSIAIAKRDAEIKLHSCSPHKVSITDEDELFYYIAVHFDRESVDSQRQIDWNRERVPLPRGCSCLYKINKVTCKIEKRFFDE